MSNIVRNYTQQKLTCLTRHSTYSKPRNSHGLSFFPSFVSLYGSIVCFKPSHHIHVHNTIQPSQQRNPISSHIICHLHHNHIKSNSSHHRPAACNLYHKCCATSKVVLHERRYAGYLNVVQGCAFEIDTQGGNDFWSATGNSIVELSLQSLHLISGE